jgi:hypothetical protein
VVNSVVEHIQQTRADDQIVRQARLVQLGPQKNGIGVWHADGMTSMRIF